MRLRVIALDPASIWHQSLNAVDIREKQAFIFGVCLPHHSVSSIDADVMNGVYRSFVGIEK
jgi:hypothetical protein